MRSFNRPRSHFETINNTITHEDVQEISEYQTKMIENNKVPMIDEVEDDK